eukprot:GHVR01087830.1.p1 GENE.GHVR01087830.1~~GHVR01087830.1.p1  ORF type:complete len:105 (+),score=5.66 GHVR01087830.1:899-1213(+)
MLLVSNRFPTNDEIKHSKIIRVFISDMNRNVYKIDKEIHDLFLNLKEESEERKISELVPIVPPNILVEFKSLGLMKKQSHISRKSMQVLEIVLEKEPKFKLIPQ